MSKVSMSTQLPASPKDIWDLIGGFNKVADWHPLVASSDLTEEGDVQIRRLTLVGGGSVVERLEKLDDAGRRYSYTILESPLPVSGYHATLHVRDADSGTGSVVEWSSEFEAAGAAPEEAMKAIQGIYEAGLDNLRKLFRV